MDLRQRRSKLETRLHSIFYELKSYPGFQVEDDTVLLKFQTSLQSVFQKRDDAFAWSKRVGLLEFLIDVLEEEFISSCSKDYGQISFALNTLAYLIVKEDCFTQISQTKLLQNFLKMLPTFRKNMSLSCASLKVFHSIMSHNLGSEWVFNNGFWEQLLFPCLESQNIFVQQECVKAICTYLLKANSEKFGSCIHDLELVRIKFMEQNQTLMGLCEERTDVGNKLAIKKCCAQLQTINQTVLLIFNELLMQTLGKQPMYTRLRSVFDLTSHMLHTLNSENTSDVILLSKMLLLSTMHRFQEQLLKYGTAEQYHLDSVISDLLTLTRHMIKIGHFSSFLKASMVVHKYWQIMATNIRDQIDAELSKGIALLYFVTRIQLIPTQTVYSSSVLSSLDEDSSEQNYLSRFVKWNEESYEAMVLRKEHKEEIKRLEELMTERMMKDRDEADRLVVSCVKEGLAILEYLDPSIAVMFFKACTFIFHFKSKASNIMYCNPRLQQLIIDALHSLLDRFSIDWKNCWLSVCMLELLCGVVWMPGINAKVKVSALKAMACCVRKFTPPAMTALVEANTDMDSSLLQAGKVMTIYLSDTEWEVRDSALEFILECMELANDKYPFFVDWILNHKLVDAVVFAVGDAEPYVQASALNVIASFVPLEKVWLNIEGKGIKQLGLRSVLKAGEGLVRKAGFQLLKSLYASAKFTDEEINVYVIPVVHKITLDIDEDLRLLALELINLHLENELLSVGMVDGVFPRVTFYKGKITHLDETDIRGLVLSVVSWFCRNGYCFGVLGCLRDPVEKVSLKAEFILNVLCSLITNYGLKHDLEYLSGNDFDKATDKVQSPQRDEASSADLQRSSKEVVENTSGASKEDLVNNGIEFVLGTPDLKVISSLPTIEYNPASSLWWWNGDATSHPLTLKEIPVKLPSVSSAQLFKEFDIFSNDKKELDDETTAFERDFLFLLDDILIDDGDISEKKTRDCY